MNIYDIEVVNIDGSITNLSEYKNKVILVVNTATKCGFTPQYTELQELYEKYNGELVILDFPCNQFKEQAPGTAEEIHEACSMNYGIKFPQFNLVAVNGENTAPIYKYLKEQTKTKKVRWNFEKFLVAKDGSVVKRYNSLKKPSKIEKQIIKLLAK